MRRESKKRSQDDFKDHGRGAPAEPGLIASAVVFGVFANLLMPTGPLFMLQVYDRVLAARAEETLLALFLLVMLLFTIYGVLEYSRGGLRRAPGRSCRHRSVMRS